MDIEKLNAFIKGLIDTHGDIDTVQRVVGNSTVLAEKFLIENPDCDISRQALSTMIFNRINNPSSLFETKEENEIDVNVTEKERYKFIGNTYVWESKRAGSMKITLDQADAIFKAYSKYGEDLSSTQVRDKFNLTNSQWYSLCYALSLYKKSDIISPERQKITPKEDLPTLYNEMFDEAEKTRREILENESQKYYQKEYIKGLREKNKRILASNIFMDNLMKMVPEVDKQVVTITNSSQCQTKEIFVTIADLHIGAEVTLPMHHTPEFSVEVVRRRLKQIADIINTKKAKVVNLAILGDLVESFTGLNHINSFKQIGYGMYGGNLLVTARDILKEFFGNISNLENIYIIGGNHDRSTSSHKEDTRSECAFIITSFLQAELGNIFNIVFDPLILTHDSAHTHIIMIHGDKKIIRQDKTEQLYAEYGSKEDKFNIVVAGHLHSRGMDKDSRYLRWYKCPAVFSGNQYSEENGWNARPGFLIIEDSQSQCLPIVTDYTLAD